MDAAYRERFDRIRHLRESYEEWHRLGIAAFERGDFPSVADALQAERAVVLEQQRLMDDSKEHA